jgi:hypothetical protein
LALLRCKGWDLKDPGPLSFSGAGTNAGAIAQDQRTPTRIVVKRFTQAAAPGYAWRRA